MMNKAASLLLAVLVAYIAFFGSQQLPAFAHNETIVGDVKIVGGWVDEPPLVGQLNGIELHITVNSSGEAITNAVGQVEVSVQKGTVTKVLTFLPAEERGVYTADIIPTQTGQYAIVFRGTIAGQAIDKQIEIEDVGDTRTLEFPPGQGSNPISEELIEQLQGVIADLNSQVEQATLASEEAVESARAATLAASELRESADRAYLFGMVGVGVGVAGVAIGVIALSKRESKA